MTTYTAVKWTKISDGYYQFNDTDYQAVKNEGYGWYVLHQGKQATEPLATSPVNEPTREFAGYAIQALIAEESR